MMFENTKPVMKFTLSRFTSFSASCLPTSGLNWSSPISTSAGRPPSLPPFSFTASMKRVADVDAERRRSGPRAC